MAIREIACSRLAPFVNTPAIPFLSSPLVVVPLRLIEVIVLPEESLSAACVKGVKSLGTAVPSEAMNRRVVRFAQGTVKESGVPVCRRVCAIRRDTLAPLATAMSDAGGSFHLEWMGYSGKVVILIFDDTTDEMDYNCKVFDLVESVY